MRTTSPGCGAIGVSPDITTVTGSAAGPAPDGLALGGLALGGLANGAGTAESGVELPAVGVVGLVAVVAAGEGLGVAAAAGSATVRASIAAAAASRGRRWMRGRVSVKPCLRADRGRARSAAARRRTRGGPAVRPAAPTPLLPPLRRPPTARRRWP